MKRVSFLFFAAFLLVSTISFAQKAPMEPEAAKLYNKGNKLIKSGDYQGAIKDYEEALTKAKDYRIYYQEGIAYKKLRKFDKAEEAFKACIQTNPDFAAAYNGLGTTYYSKKDYQKAIDNFKLFAEKAKKKKLKKRAKRFISLAYTKLGVKEINDHKYNKAVEYLKQAVDNYEYDAAYLQLANAYIELGKYKEALAAADNAIKFRAKRSRVPKGAPYFYKGLAYKGMNDKSSAKANFKIASKDKLYRAQSKYEMKYMN